MNSPLPQGALLITTADYAVPVRLLQGPRGLLLVQTEAEIAAKYADMKGDVEVAMAADPEDERRKQLARLDAAEAQEKELFAELERQRAADFQTYTFVFRQATIEDEEAAEAEANRTQPRLEIAFRRALAQRTYKSTDLPEFGGFGRMRTDLALHVMREVAQRITFSVDIRDFFLTPAGSAGPG